MSRHPLKLVLFLVAALSARAEDAPKPLQLHLRSRVEAFKGSGSWDEVHLQREVTARESAIVICDMWDKHWCPSATRRCGEIAQKMAPILRAARARGVLIIHAPSDTMDFYKDHPRRKAAQALPKVDPPKPRELPEPALPVDASDGGCEEPVASFKAWSRQHPALDIDDADYITDNGREVYAALRKHGIKHLFIMGVHTNMCVLGRSFAIRQMTKWGVPCVLVRDLTDSMYNPKKSPFVSHEAGTELIIQHIEKYWCPTVLSADLSR